MAYPARAFQIREDSDHTRENSPAPHCTCHLDRSVHSILHRHHDGRWTEQGSQQWESSADLPRLDAQQDDIDRPDARSALAHPYLDVFDPTVGILDPQPSVAHGSQVRPPRQQNHVGTVRSQPGTEIATHGTRAHDSPFHRRSTHSEDLSLEFAQLLRGLFDDVTVLVDQEHDTG